MTTNVTKSATIEWSPFSKKHRDYIRTALKSSMSVAEGAIRSGKTIDHCIIAAAFLDECADKFHLATGSTVANAKLNIGVCNGYGLENLFRGRCEWGKYRNNEVLYITDRYGREKIVVFAGGGKADSFKAILGNSYGLWIATEINEHYDCDDSRTSFLKVATGRQAAAKQPMTLWDLNPNHPNHPIYTQYIDKYQESGLPGGYNYQLFTMHDNLSITEQRRREIEAKYEKGSVWYRRDILGQRVRAEGLIYATFANNLDEYIIDRDQADYDFITLGMDIGGNKSYHTIVATGLCYDYRAVTALASIRIKATDTTPQDIERELRKFLDMVQQRYGYIETLYFESAEQIIKNHLVEKIPELTIKNSIKNEIMHRVRAGCMLTDLPSPKLKIVRDDCDSLIQALCGAVYDPKAAMLGEDKRLDNGTTDIDTLDAFEYSWEVQIKHL